MMTVGVIAGFPLVKNDTGVRNPSEPMAIDRAACHLGGAFHGELCNGFDLVCEGRQP